MAQNNFSPVMIEGIPITEGIQLPSGQIISSPTPFTHKLFGPILFAKLQNGILVEIPVPQEFASLQFDMKLKEISDSLTSRYRRGITELEEFKQEILDVSKDNLLTKRNKTKVSQLVTRLQEIEADITPPQDASVKVMKIGQNEDDWILVRIILRGPKKAFLKVSMLDTGAQFSVTTPQVVETLGASPTGEKIRLESFTGDSTYCDIVRMQVEIDTPSRQRHRGIYSEKFMPQSCIWEDVAVYPQLKDNLNVDFLLGKRLFAHAQKTELLNDLLK